MMSAIWLIVGVVGGILISFTFPEQSQFVNDTIMNVIEGALT